MSLGEINWDPVITFQKWGTFDEIHQQSWIFYAKKMNRNFYNFLMGEIGQFQDCTFVVIATKILKLSHTKFLWHTNYLEERSKIRAHLSFDKMSFRILVSRVGHLIHLSFSWETPSCNMASKVATIFIPHLKSLVFFLRTAFANFARHYRNSSAKISN